MTASRELVQQETTFGEDSQKIGALGSEGAGGPGSGVQGGHWTGAHGEAC